MKPNIKKLVNQIIYELEKVNACYDSVFVENFIGEVLRAEGINAYGNFGPVGSYNEKKFESYLTDPKYKIERQVRIKVMKHVFH